MKMRQDMVDRFQLGEIDVLICTYGVGSTGGERRQIDGYNLISRNFVIYAQHLFDF